MTDFAKLVLTSDTKGLKRGEADLNKMGGTAKTTAGAVDKSNSKMTKSFAGLSRLGILPMVASFGAAAVSIRGIISSSMAFEKGMANISTLVDTTSESMDRMGSKVLEISRSMPVAISDLTSALYDVRSAGISAGDAMGVLENSGKLAVAGLGSTKEAVDIVTSSINAFGLKGEEVDGVYDLLFQTIKNGKTTLPDLASGFGAVAGTVAKAGIELDEYLASVAAMTTTGLPAAQAHTQLRAAIAGLTRETELSVAVFTKLGAKNFPDLIQKAGGMVEAFKQISGALGNNDAEIIKLLGSVEAYNAVVGLTGGQNEAFTQTLATMRTEVGALEEAFGKQSQTLEAQAQMAKNSLESMGIAIGAILAPALRELTTLLGLVANNMQTLFTVIGTAVVSFGTYKVAMLAASAATSATAVNLGFFATAVATTTTRVGVLAGAQVAWAGVTAGATTAVRALTAAMITNPFTAVAVAIGVVSGALFLMSQRQREARAETNSLIMSLRGLAQARGEEWELARVEAVGKQSGIQNEIGRLEGLGRRPGLAGSFAAEGTSKELFKLRQDLLLVNNELFHADKAYAAATKAAEGMVVPVAGVATAAGVASGKIDDATGSSTKAAKGMDAAAIAAKKLEDAYSSLSDRLDPVSARTNQYKADLATLGATADATTLQLSRLNKEYMRDMKDVNPLSRAVMEQGPLIDVAGQDLAGSLDKMAIDSKVATVKIADTFTSMVDSALASLDQLIAGIKGGSFVDILRGVLGLVSQLSGTGLFGSGMKNFFGGARAAGGPVSSGSAYLVGEEGPELFVPNGGGTIVPNDKTQQMGSGGSTYNISVDARGSTDPEMVRQQVFAGIREAAPMLIAASESRTVKTLTRKRLAGGMV
jgi:TP901 family phage tail tape measure protein